MIGRVIVLAGLIALSTGCGGPAPTTPPAMAPSLAGWASAGLACAGPTPSDNMAGLLAWTCSGNLAGTDVAAAMDGDARGVFLASVSLPAGTDRAAIVAAFAKLADATTAYAATGPQIHAWIEAWGGGVDGATFGTTSVAIAQLDVIGSGSTVTMYLTGPRKNLADPIP
jgi:hypothetical protein